MIKAEPAPAAAPVPNNPDQLEKAPISFTIGESKNKPITYESTRKVMSIAERTQLLYSASSKPNVFADDSKQASTRVVREALMEELDSHKVMYQYMFVENKKKKADMLKQC